MIATAKPTRCPGCRSVVEPIEITKGPSTRESLDVAVLGLAAWVLYAVDPWHLKCPKCDRIWRPRLRERSLAYRCFAAIVLAVAIGGGAYLVFRASITGAMP